MSKDHTWFGPAISPGFFLARVGALAASFPALTGDALESDTWSDLGCARTRRLASRAAVPAKSTDLRAEHPKVSPLRRPNAANLQVRTVR